MANVTNSGPAGPPTALSSLTVAGVPIITSGGAPFFTGNWYFCDAVNGSDGNPGSANFPVQTLSQAYSLTTSGHNDVVVIVSDGTTASTQRISSTLTWAKNATHLIGMAPPVRIASRARIAPLTTATTNINPLVSVTGNDCMFANFSFFQGIGQASTDEKLIDITGQRNYFGLIDFGGMGHTNGATRAGSYIIGLGDGCGENTFDTCTVGLETVQRSGANSSVLVKGPSTQRNNFYNCQFMMAASATSPLFLDLSAANCLNGSSMTFRNCIFQNLTGISAASNPAVVATLNATVNGVLVIDQCTTNATKWASATSQMIISGYAAGNGFSSGTFATAANS
jgi:hypothetical protein